METTTWVLDPTHSEIQFKIKHLMISTVTGQFNQFSGTIETEGDNFTTAKVHFEAEVNSISTNNEQRDAHLKTGDFFHATEYPK
jgi:polyisoprenoid-binding protein YceI